MKNNTLLLIAMLLIFNACKTKNTNEAAPALDSIRNNSATAIDSGNSNSTSQGNMKMVDKDDSDFVMKAASGGMMEVEAGKVAEKNAKSQRVKDFAAMIITDHTNNNEKLKDIATAKNIMLPAGMMPEHMKNVHKLTKLSSNDFDKAYIDMMIDDHKEDISDFKKAADKVKDSDIKSFAATTLPTLQKHLDSAQAIHNGM